MGTHPIFESDFDCLTEMSRHDFTRDPCPWRLVEDMGGAYSMGLVGGGIWAGGKSIVRREFRYLARNVRQNAPRTAAGFAVWESVETQTTFLLAILTFYMRHRLE